MVAGRLKGALPVTIDADVAGRAAPSMAAVIAYEACAQPIYRKILQPRVQCGTHLQACVVEALGTVFPIENAPDFFHEVVGVLRLNPEWAHLRDQRLGQRSAFLLTR